MATASRAQSDLLSAFRGSQFERELKPISSTPPKIKHVTDDKSATTNEIEHVAVLDSDKEHDIAQHSDDPQSSSGLQNRDGRDKGLWHVQGESDSAGKVNSNKKIYEIGYVNGTWSQEADAQEFGKESDTYKIIADLGKRWYTTNNAQNKEELYNMANEARRLAREGTPLLYGQDKVMNLLHANAQEAQRYMNKMRSYWLYDWSKDFDYRVAYLIGKTDKGDWDYKYNSEWQVPYAQFNAKNMNVDNNKNWNAWIYFDGMIMGADKVGNMNMAYVGAKLGLPKYVYQNSYTTDKDDAFWVQYAIDMAEQGR